MCHFQCNHSNRTHSFLGPKSYHFREQQREAERKAQKEKEEELAKSIASGDTIPGRTMVAESKTVKKSSARTRKRTSTAKKAKARKVKSSSSNQPNSSAMKSVRRRKR